LIELRECGERPRIDAGKDPQQQRVNAIINVMPDQTHLVGWSLGGLLAQQIAIQVPEKVKSLTCLASTPRFIQAKDWHWAVQPELMTDFMQALSKDTAATLTHFWKLQIQGSDGARQLIKLFISQMKQRKLPKVSSLSQGLQLLQEMDNRQELEQLKRPVLWLLGENDPLIPKEFVEEFSTIQPQAEIGLVQGAAHMPFFSHPEETANTLLQFINKQ